MLVFVLIVGTAGLMIAYEKIVKMPGASYEGPRVAPANERERLVDSTLRHDVAMLADVLGERNLTNAPERLSAAEAWITQELEQTGLTMNRLPYTVDGEEVANVEGVKLGTTKPEEIIIIGAHYDSAPGTAGANDNGSGVAGLLALARLTRDTKFARTLRFVAFVNEEPPYFQQGDMGSQVYALACKRAGEKIVGMICLETIGYYSDAANSQNYPPEVAALYPTTGNFIAFVGNLDSRPLLDQCIGTFRQHAKLPSQGIAAPPGLGGVDLSDHASFWDLGYPAIMLTDTAPFRYPYYHTAQDLPEHLDYEQMTQLVVGLVPVVEAVAEAESAPAPAASATP